MKIASKISQCKDYYSPRLKLSNSFFQIEEKVRNESRKERGVLAKKDWSA